MRVEEDEPWVADWRAARVSGQGTMSRFVGGRRSGVQEFSVGHAALGLPEGLPSTQRAAGN